MYVLPLFYSFADHKPLEYCNYFYSLSSTKQPLLPVRIKENAVLNKEKHQREIWKNSKCYTLLYDGPHASFYLQTYNKTYSASRLTKEIKDELTENSQIIPVSKMQKAVDTTTDYISEDDVHRAFSPVVLHHGLYEILQTHKRPSKPLNLTSDGKLLLVEEVVRNRIAYIRIFNGHSTGKVQFWENCSTQGLQKAL